MNPPTETIEEIAERRRIAMLQAEKREREWRRIACFIMKEYIELKESYGVD